MCPSFLPSLTAFRVQSWHLHKMPPRVFFSFSGACGFLSVAFLNKAKYPGKAENIRKVKILIEAKNPREVKVPGGVKGAGGVKGPSCWMAQGG